MSKSVGAAKSALIIIMLTLISKFLGFFRETLIASKFGSGIETDTFFVALTATSLVTVFITKAISTTFIPVLSEIESREGKEGKINHTNNIINIIFLISIILVIIQWLATPIIVRLIAKGFKGDQFKLAIKMTRIGLPTVLFGGITGVLTGYLQSEERFISTSLVGVPSNFIYIFFLIFLSNKLKIEGLMIFTIIAVASQFIMLIPEIRMSGYKHKFKLDFRDKYIRKVIALSFPILIGVAINDINQIIDRTLASSLVSGSISALSYAAKLKEIILGVFIAAITTVIYPILSKESNSDNIPGMKKIMDYGINLIIIITVPATFGLIVLSTPIVQVAFQRGQFDCIATTMTSQALIFYSIGLVSMAVKPLLNRVYYSLQDTKTPVLNSGVAVVINIVLNIILIKYMAHSGLALATSISATITSFLLLYGLKKKIGSIGTRGYIRTFIKTGLASTMMGGIAYFTYHGVYEALGVSQLYNMISLLVSIIIGGVVYLVLCYLLKVQIIMDIVKKIKTP